MQRHQRGRARGIDRHRGSLQPKCVSNTTAYHAPRTAGHLVTLELSRQILSIATRVYPREDPGVTPAQRGRVDTRTLKCLPTDFEQDPLLRIHRECLSGTDPEELSVELVDVVHKAALSCIARALPLRIGVIKFLQIPSAIGRELSDRVLTGVHQSPEILWRARSTRITTAHRDDRYRLLRACDARPRRGNALEDPRRLAQHVPREQNRCWIVKDDGRRETHTCHRLKTLSQLDRCQRIKAELPKRPLRSDSVQFGMPQHTRCLGAHQLQHHTLTLTLR